MEQKQLGQYVIEADLGEGSFARVYRARDVDLDRVVALKVLKSAWMADRMAIQRFKQEARTMAKLDENPHIAVIYGVGESEGEVYLAQKLVDGESLAARLTRGPLSWPEILDILRPIASALDYAHQKGVIHRDIKPGNILLDKSGKTYLSDFGLVKAAEGSESLSASIGGVKGTASYIPPEIWDGEEAVPASDVYALSCVVFEMLTGEVLFEGSSMMQVMRKHDKGPQFPDIWPEGIPAGVTEPLQRGLAADPKERIQNAGELVTALEALQTPVRAAGATEAAQLATAELLAAQKAETERKAAAQAEAERLAAEKAETERLAAEKAEAERQAAEQAEAERLAAEKAERERKSTPGLSPPPSPVTPEHQPSPQSVAQSAASRGINKGLLIGGGVALLVIVCVAIFFAMQSGPAQPETIVVVETVVVEKEVEEAAEEPAEEAMEAATCEDALGCVTVDAGDDLKIASALVIAGPNAPLGIDTQVGVEIAIGHRGQVAGHGVELVAEDGGCSAEGGQTVATKIASDDTILGVVGHNCSSSCTPAAPIYNDAGVTMISPSCTAPALTGEGTHVDSFLRTAHNDNLQGRVMAEFVYNELGLRSAATIHDGSPYAEQLQQVFVDTFAEMGGTITAQEAVNVGDTDMRPVLTSIASGGPELLYYPIFIAEGGFITAQAKEITGLENTILAGADGMQSPQFVEAAGPASANMYLSGPDLSFENEIYTQFLSDYADLTGGDPTAPFHAHAYDAALMLFDAIEAVAQKDADGNTLVGRQALRDALYATSGLDGITGSINCNEMGDCADPQIAVNQVQDGAFVPVYQSGEMLGEMAEAGGEEAMGELAPAGLIDVDGLLVQSAGDCAYGGKIAQIKALDESTVGFTMCSPEPAFVAKAAFTPFFIQPREWIEETGGTGELLKNPVGTGPYMLDDWNRGDSIIFKRFDDYWGDPAATETLVFRWASEGAARLLELQSGTVDHITRLSPDDYDTVRNDSNLQFLPVVNPNILYLGMSNFHEPFDNPDVRKAIAMGVDRQRIIDNFFPAGSEVASHFTPCSIENACQGEEWYEFDPEAARSLLAEAGYPDGFKTTIYYRDVFRTYLPEPGLVAVEFQNQLKENLNIDAEVAVMESGEFISESIAGNLEGFYLLGWGADFLHVTNFLDFHFGKSSPQYGAPYPEIYDILQEASTIGDPTKSAPLYQQANNAIKEIVPMVPIAHGAMADAAWVSVNNAHTAVLGPPDLWDVDPGKDTLVYMQVAEPISLYCGDATDGESLSACKMVTEGLYKYDKDGNAVPTLATGCKPNKNSTIWICTLRKGVKFHDGSTVDANDVVMSWAVGIDAANPYHVGNTGGYAYFSYLWDGLMNAE